jgi:hypothetical protein
MSYKIRPTFSAPETVPSGSYDEFTSQQLLNNGPKNVATDLDQAHPLERLDQDTEAQLKMQIVRNSYGLGAVLRLQMEQQLVGLNMPSLHREMLAGSTETIEPSDIFKTLDTETIHQRMERLLSL